MSRKLGAFNPASTATTSLFADAIDISKVSLYLPFDDDFNDKGPLGVTSTAAGNVSLDTTNKKHGTSAVHTSNGYIKFVNSSSLTLGSSDFTIAGYYRSSNVSQTAIFYNKRSNNTKYNSVYVGTVGGNMVASGTTNGSSWNLIPVNTPFGSLTNNTFHHFALVRYGSTLTGYLDGVGTVLTTSAGTVYDAGHNVHLGGDTNGFRLTGQLDDILVLKGQALYLSNFTPPTQPYIQEDTRSHSHVWNYSDIYKARRADTWPDLVYDTQIALYLPFNGSLTDFSSYGHTVSAVGDAAVTTSPFQLHASCAFDGNGDLLTVPHNNIFDFGGNDFTIEGFINPTTAAGVQGVYSQWGGTGSRSFKVVISTNAKLEINGSKDGSTGTQVNQIASTGLELNTFSHFAVTRDGSNFRIFINGVNRGTTTDSGALYNSSANIAIGGNRADQTTNTLHGNLEDFRVINGLALYTTAFEVPTRAINNTLTVNP